MPESYRYRPKLFWLVLVLVSLAALTGFGYYVFTILQASAVYIVEPGNSIQAVLDTMPAGEVCYIKPGVYQEALTIKTPDQTIRRLGEGKVVIDAGGAANAVLIQDISGTVLEGLTIRNSAKSLILITGPGASNNTVRQCTLLEWGLDGVSLYVGAVDSSNGASYTTVNLCYIDRGNHEAFWTQNPEAITYHFSGGHHTITNNIIWGVCRDNLGNPIKIKEDFGDGYPLYKYNIIDCMCGEDGEKRIDFDGTIIVGNHLYGAHDDMIGVQGLDRSCTVSGNYIDAMGGSVCIVLRGASVGPVYVTNNIMVNSGINCIKYGSWPLGSGMAEKYISGNIYYSTLGRSYIPADKVNGQFYVAEVYLQSYSRFLDGEVNQSDYDNLHVDNNRVYCRRYFLCLAPDSGVNNTFTNNHFSTVDIQFCVKWYSNSHPIDFATFNSYVGDTNIWEVIPKPDEPLPPLAGADLYVPPDFPY